MSRVYVIAEAGVNHNGDLSLALDLVEAAAKAGADAVKFQTFKAELVASTAAAKAKYQKELTEAGESQVDMLRRLELTPEMHLPLMARCRELGIEFLSTAFDLPSLELLLSLGLSRLKVPSGEITNAPLLLAAARSGLPVILSTGMSDLDEVREALGVLAFGIAGEPGRPGLEAFRRAYASPRGKKLLRERATLLHCTTEYPAPFADVNLKAMRTLHEAFGLAVGYSDHTPGIAVPVAAAALGATVVEKHFTMDRNLPGPDHKASLIPEELAAMTASIRQVEAALGDGVKTARPSELGNRDIARKSLVAARPIRAGETFTIENLTVKRPGSGVSPMRYWEYLGRSADQDYARDEVIR